MKKKVLERRKLLLGILWFLIKLNILVIPLYLLMAMNLSFPQFQSGLASALGSALSFLGYPTIVKDFYIGISSGYTVATFEINLDCTGWKSMYALTALAIATPMDQKRKLKFLAIALPFIFALNYARILTTIVLSFRYGFQYLEVVHTFLWREGLIFAVLATWYIWLRRINYNIREMKIPFRWNFA
ncbi:MAG TPA: exosortase/archaeosortase family protein [archaeon]|nr:exosortase/archaeosortase family protein [archaeon]